ncbi:MAG TPA: ABC transporter permease [Candidatus Binataceae bacterium]|nr:ABC transporter permease [Candidatus Binataceae bacterium]
MLRAIWLTVQNEARLLIKDPIVLFMLLFAPLVIITVAGYSLGSLYGSVTNSFRVPVVDLDHGAVSNGIIAALKSERSVAVELLDNPEEARRLVTQRARTPIAIVIPAGTSAALAAGQKPHLILFVDPVRQIEVDALELRISELCRVVNEQARLAAQKQLEASSHELHDKLSRLTAEVEQEQTKVRTRVARSQAAIESSVRKQIAEAQQQATTEAEATIKEREGQAWRDVEQQLSQKQAILMDIQRYLIELQSSQHAFEQWLQQLKALAGSHASDIPPPPAFPKPVSEVELAELTKPVTPPKVDSTLPQAPTNAFSIKIAKKTSLGDSKLSAELEQFQSLNTPTLPGTLGFVAQPAGAGEAVAVNAFDLYVPGFGITFLLIGMMLGVALTLFDERDWGTLKRLQVSGAPLPGLLIGKLIARIIVGIAQMVLLFAAGWALFGIALGRNPFALLIPITAISFAAAALGLLIASISRAHDSVMPLGVTISMAMAAIGGCWWPLDFEPGWMRDLAQWMPTTWTMQSFNDLMVRNQPWSVSWRPLAITMGLGTIFLVVGIIRFVTLKD